MKQIFRTPPDLEKPRAANRNWNNHGREALERAVLHTVAYADVFDYPLAEQEIHRYLASLFAPLEAVRAVLRDRHFQQKFLCAREGYFTLPGREALVRIRQRRSVAAAALWRKAAHYGRKTASLPFVRMVAVTGALAVDNVEYEADLDYLVVTEAGRLWLCRAMVILLVRWAALYGEKVCPNYFLSEKALIYPQRNLYSAHEMTQMVPVAGLDVYWRMRQLNDWTQDFLPNAAGLPPRQAPYTNNHVNSGLRLLVEKVLRTQPAASLERWEMERKVRKFSDQSGGSGEATFCADWCKGHFDEHEGRTLAAFTRRLKAFGIEERVLEE